jgi:hypothetical protein
MPLNRKANALSVTAGDAVLLLDYGQQMKAGGIIQKNKF